MKKSLLSRLRLKESWVLFFILGVIMMNFPFISIFDKPDTLFGMPLLYFYLQVGWFISILVIVVFARSIDQNNNDKS
jgi:uncharacterized membrane protein